MNTSNDRKPVEYIMIIAGIMLLGSIWGLLECTLGGLKWEVFGLNISMGSVMAGSFGLAFMILARRMFNFTGAAFLVALVAGSLRFVAPVGSCVICSAIAIGAEGLVFEIILSRKSFRENLFGNKDFMTLAFLGVISGFTIFTVGYITTQIMTPVFTGGTLVMMDVFRIIPLIIGRSFYAAVLGGIFVPVIVLYDNLHLDLNKLNKGIYFTASSAFSILCWVMVLFILF